MKFKSLTLYKPLIFLTSGFLLWACSKKIDLAPNINSYTPDRSELNVFTLRDYQFTINATDPDGEIISAEWFINGNEISYSDVFAQNFSQAITINFSEKDAGKNVDLTVKIKDKKNVINHNWSLKVYSPLYLTRLIMSEIASPSSVTSIYYDSNKLNLLKTLFRDSLQGAEELYRNKDYDEDGIDDYYFVSITGEISEGILLFIDLLSNLTNFEGINDLKVFQPRYYLEPLLGNPSGIVPGADCSILFSANPFIAPIAREYLDGLSSTIGEIINYFEGATTPLVDYEITMDGEREFKIGGDYSFLFKGILDRGDVLFFSSTLYLFNGLWEYLKTYSDDTINGIISYILDPCYYYGPWADADNFPDFGQINSNYSGHLSTARDNLSKSAFYLSEFLQFLTGKNQNEFYMTSISSDKTLNTSFSIRGRTLSFSGIDWDLLSNALEKLSGEILSQSSSTLLSDVFQLPLSYAGVYLNWSSFFNAPIAITSFIPLYVEGEGWTDQSGGNYRLYDLPEPCLDKDFNKTCNEGIYLDTDGNGEFTTGDNFTDSKFPKGNNDGIYEAQGDFYVDREVSFFYDTGSDGLLPFSPGYPGPDRDGTEGNGLYDDGEPSEGQFFSQSVTHPWPDNSGKSDPDNGVIDYFYFFFPDPSFAGAITPATEFDPDGTDDLSNGDINALLSNIREKLGRTLKYK